MVIRSGQHPRAVVPPRSKRALDLLVSALGLCVFAPLGLGVVAAIKLDSTGPAFFNSVRVGRNGRPFTMYKFRTMVVDAEERLQALQPRNRGGDLLIKIPNDPRVTRVGRFLRRTSLDEVPQLLNVLRGDMSLVGPRPQYPREVAHYTSRQRRRLSVLPGITGLWQVSARDCPDFDEWVRYDLAYIDGWSFLLDLAIIRRTFGAMLRQPDEDSTPERVAVPATEGRERADSLRHEAGDLGSAPPIDGSLPGLDYATCQMATVP